MNGDNDMGLGFLQIRVTTGNTAIPLGGANITIRRNEQGASDVLFELRSGTPAGDARIPLSTTPAADSMRPQTERPYSTYNIRVRLPGYETAEFLNVPIFDGITAYQQVNLIPNAENGYPDNFSFNGVNIYNTADNEL